MGAERGKGEGAEIGPDFLYSAIVSIVLFCLCYEINVRNEDIDRQLGVLGKCRIEIGLISLMILL